MPRDDRGGGRQPRRKGVTMAPPRAKTESVDLFISHDSRDQAVALAFYRLLDGASGGKIGLFFSSDLRGRRGIPVGTDWERVMLESLRQAKTVVALLTQQALGSPWVLFEIGFAKRRPGVKVFSLALGITKAEASEGPLAQTQNSADSEAEITKLVMDLLKFHLGTAPEETAILPLVRAFRRSVGRLREKKGGEKPEDHPRPPRGVEPAKVRKAEPVYEPRGFERTLGPRFFREFPLLTEKGFDGLGWLLFIAMIRHQVPWLYSIGLDLYRALSAGGKEEVRQARDLILGIVQRGVRNDWLLGALAEDDADQANRLFHFAEVVEDYLGQLSDEKLDAAP